jgi:pimeloyl-ACP methyl ester carboxylesterase
MGNKNIFNLQFFAILTTVISSYNIQAQQQMTIGRYKSRAIFNQSTSTQCPAPLVIMIPGSGANGPEEMMPASLTGDGLDHSLFASFSEGLQKGLVGTLALGKPGVDFFKSWDNENWFYDQTQFEELTWQDLIDNLKDAVEFSKTLPCVDPNKIFVLGHSEGTQVAADFATQDASSIHGIILVGFSGENLATTVNWQLFKRSIDSFLEPDVDVNHDGYISKEEASHFPHEFKWNWEPDQTEVSLEEIEKYLRENKDLQNLYQSMANSKIWKGIFNRTPVYEEIASLPIDVYVFTGTLDVQTRPEEALKLKNTCMNTHKLNCEVQLVEGLGHGMSKPSLPRQQKLLDATLGPVDPLFIDRLSKLANKLF